jgi:hypothetical protein
MRRDLAEARQKALDLAARSFAPEGVTDTVADAFGRYPINLAPGRPVRFILGDRDGDYIEAHVDVVNGERTVDVRSGWRGLAVRPVASNHARLALADL